MPDDELVAWRAPNGEIMIATENDLVAVVYKGGLELAKIFAQAGNERRQPNAMAKDSRAAG